MQSLSNAAQSLAPFNVLMLTLWRPKYRARSPAFHWVQWPNRNVSKLERRSSGTCRKPVFVSECASNAFQDYGIVEITRKDVASWR